MANTTLRKGSKGEEVKNLQNALINAGYDVGSTGADGSFGKNTLAAVKEYQQDNGLTVDGIVGKNTWASLNSSSSTSSTNTANAGSNKPAATQPATSTDNASAKTDGGKSILYGNLTDKSAANQQDLIGQAWDTLEGIKANKPGDYQYGADYGIANDYLSQYQNRDPFSYDFNSDALYNMYKDQYIQQGQMAMMDTMGQAAAMTGGYGSSYGQAVGQQTYNQYLSQLNEIIPELSQMAYDRYYQEGQDMLNMYNLYMNRENDNYSKYLDSVDLWNQDVTNAQNSYNALYNEYVNAYDQKYTEEQDAKAWEYQQEQDAKTDQNTKYNRLANLISSSGYEPKASELKEAGMSEAEAKALKKGYTSSMVTTSGNTSGNTTGNTKKYADFDYETQKKWTNECLNQNSWDGLAAMWRRMKAANIDPVEAAYMVVETAYSKNGDPPAMTPSIDDLKSLANNLVSEGVPEDKVGALFDEWAGMFGYEDPTESLPQSNLLGMQKYGSGLAGSTIMKNMIK